MPQPRHSHFEALDPDSKRTVLHLTPLLRIADALDRGHEQKVSDVANVTRDGNVSLSVQADQDADLEIWAANEAAKTFRDVYAKPISLQRAKPARG